MSRNTEPGPEFNPYIAVRSLLVVTQEMMRRYDVQNGNVKRMMRVTKLSDEFQKLARRHDDHYRINKSGQG